MSAATLARLEPIIDRAEVCEPIETLLPVGVRPRQLSVRTLLLGMLLVAVEGRPAHLRRVHQRCSRSPRRPAPARRARVLERRPAPAHLPPARVHLRRSSARSPTTRPTAPRHGCSQTSSTSSWKPASRPRRARVAAARARLDRPRNLGAPTPQSTAPPPPTRRPPGGTAPPTTPPRPTRSTATTSKPSPPSRRNGPAVPELVRRMHLAGCQHDPPAQIIPTIQRMPQAGIPIGDLLADSGYSYRQAATFALPLRALHIHS